MRKEKLFLLILLISISTLIFAQDFEGFETGNFSAYEWQLSGNANWFVTNSNPYEGTYCAQGGDINDNGITTLEITREVTDNGTISFYWKVESEGSWDYLRFYLDGTMIQEISGTVGWTQVTTNVTSGSHTFKWEYSKDGSVTTEPDTGWIDSIVFPPSVTYDNDLAGMSIVGNTIINSGNTENYDITVKNVGTNTQNAYTVKLYKNNDEELNSIDINQIISPDETVVHSLVWNVPVDEPAGIVELYGKVILGGDENNNNDETNTLDVEVFPPGVMEITVGNGADNDNRTPICFQYNNSLTETIYFSDELAGAQGMITEITYYNNFINNLINKPTAIWLGETAQTNLTDGWIPSTSLTEVFNGTITYPSGTNSVTIQLTTPYFYNGGNLVVMAFRPMDTQNFGATDNFIHDTTLEHEDRTRYERDNNIVLDPANPPEVSYSGEFFANTTFTFFLGAMGEVEGYVLDENDNPLEGASVTIEETQTVTYTDDEGFYHFGNVIAGVYDFTAEKMGYYSQTITDEVIEDEVTQVDFNLIPLGTVSVSGHVVGSDNPDIGLENAVVEITGFENYQTTTDNNGDFIIEGVYTNINYNILITYEGYDDYIDEISVGGSALDLGTLTLGEIAYPPGNVLAVQNPEGTEVALFWSSPGQGGSEFRYDDGEQAFQIGLGEPTPNSVFGAIHPFVSIINEVSWFLTSEFVSHTQVKIIIFSLDYYNLPDRDQILHISDYLPNVDDEWNTYELPEQVEAYDGFFIGVITPNQYTSIGLDDGEGEPWVFQEGTQLSIQNWQDEEEEWLDIGDINSMFQKNMMIRAMGINLGNTRSRNVSNQNYKKSTDENRNREFEGYNIYRFHEYDYLIPENWDLIANAIEDSSFTDTGWNQLPNGFFQFAVLALHTNGIESIPAYSQVIERITANSYPETVEIGRVQLIGNYPNPFNPSTMISFSLVAKNAKNTKLEIYNIRGQKVKQLVSEYLPAGQYSVTWDGRDDIGKPVSSGVYFYRLISDSKVIGTKRMLLIK